MTYAMNYHDSMDLSFLKIRVGYEKTWHQTITDVDDLSPL